MKRVIIIGSGLGGLECGLLLARRGYEVTVLEQAAQTGGCMQSYQRHGITLDTGFHYVGGLEEGQVLHPIFQQLGLLDLPWKKLPERCADRIIVGQEQIELPQGYEAFREVLSNRFPEDEQGIKDYILLMQHIANNIHNERGDTYSLFETSAYAYLNEHFHSPLLRDFLSGASLRTELKRDTLPLYSFACINNSYVQSAYTLDGGGEVLVKRLVEQIEAAGGTIITNTSAARIEEHDGKVTGVLTNKDEFEPADYIISDISPAATIQLLADDSCVRNIYRKRLTHQPLTEGIFTTSLILKPSSLLKDAQATPATYVHTCSPWQESSQQVDHMLVHTYPHGKAIDLLTPVSAAYWHTLRSTDYQAYKEQKEKQAEQSIRLAQIAYPWLTEAAAEIYTSSPATYQRYLGAQSMSAFGIRKDYQSAITTLLSPKTPLHGLLLTGQNLHLHGVLGVSMTALRTVEELIKQ